MAYKTLIFGVDDIFNELQPYYAREVQRGNLEIVAYAVLENNGIRIVPADGQSRGGGVNQSPNFELAIISSRQNFYDRMKFLEAHGIPRNRIIDGRVFKVPNLDFPRLISENVAYGFSQSPFADGTTTIYPRVYRFATNNSIFKLGKKSYIGKSTMEGHHCAISVGNFSALSWNITFEALPDNDHHYENISQYGYYHLDWYTGDDFIKSQRELCRINIGSDVWMGRGSFLKCSSLKKPLIIGDGAVIAADSVVVKNVPPYAIVGGNPAQVIKYRFPPEIVEALLRIKWWDWDIDKIYDNFKYFNDIERFVALHDK